VRGCSARAWMGLGSVGGSCVGAEVLLGAGGVVCVTKAVLKLGAYELLCV